MTAPTALAGSPLADLPDANPLTMGELLRCQASRFGSHEALVFDDPLLGGETVRWSYQDLEWRARCVARGLLAAGVGKGTRVGILMGNRPEAVASLFGVWLVGAVAVPLSTFSPAAELDHLIRHTDISILLLQTSMGNRRFANDVRALCPAISTSDRTFDPEFPYLRRAFSLGPEPELDGLESWRDFLAGGETIGDELLDAVAAQVHSSDLGVITYSSGTTAQPKGVMLNHRAVTVQCHVQASLFARDRSTRVFCALPMFWTAGLHTAMGATLAGGATWVMQEKFEAGHALHLLERERVTEPHVLAHQASALEDHADWNSTDLTSCTKVFGKSVFARHPSVCGDESWNMPVGYGMSETASFVTGYPSTTPRAVLRGGGHGYPLPGNEVQVQCPDTGAPVGPCIEGELLVRGLTLMEHYVKQTRDQCFDADGWYRTGDIGFYDDDGVVHWLGRRSEMIKTAGASVSPSEVEVQLQRLESIKLARVIGVPDDRQGQIVVLCVELQAGASVTADEITSFLGERLSSYKIPKHVVFFEAEEMPMNGSGAKVQDAQLLDAVRQRLGAR